MYVVELYVLDVSDPDLGDRIANAVGSDPEGVRRALALLHADDNDGRPEATKDGVQVAGGAALIAEGEPVQVQVERRAPVLTGQWTNERGQPVVSFERVPIIEARVEASLAASGDLMAVASIDQTALVEAYRGAQEAGATTHTDWTGPVPGALALINVTGRGQVWPWRLAGPPPGPPTFWLLASATPVQDRAEGEAMVAARLAALTAVEPANPRSTAREVRRLLR